MTNRLTVITTITAKYKIVFYLSYQIHYFQDNLHIDLGSKLSNSFIFSKEHRCNNTFSY